MPIRICKALLLLVFAGTVAAQTYPSRPVKVIVPFPPGGAPDLVGRTLANRLQEPGREKADAAREAALTRLRPVLMTTAATIFGHLPLVLVSGPGAAARNSIGTVLVSGMAVGTLFTLFVVPVFYALIAKDHRAVAAEPEQESGSLPAIPEVAHV